MNENLISACKKLQRDAQRQVYEHMAPKLYRTCKRYLKKEEEIEEIMADSFYTIFTKIDQLKESSAFEAWARKITVNHCLYQLKRNVNFNLYLEDNPFRIQPESAKETLLEEEDLLKLLNHIPEGCKTIFNLFVIEGYSHKEIAEMLTISEGTSKSQLNAAKTKLKDLVNQLYYQKAK
ncbi:MAG TPA: sigma-70 family RNA polymerase sigma factor [Flavobacterium sp.]|uniref:RNA polymerase sigma factor n=1 Tax=Flavobacterium sp. TaxID=239 RepID=UPI002BBA2DFC|nr:sigma-70 family RNA polymerase sigma factor [Flavobacterium sp.]HNP34103.1 sigma-70 family RNA polymerase sigma factor [Flavobacterium sp.]